MERNEPERADEAMGAIDAIIETLHKAIESIEDVMACGYHVESELCRAIDAIGSGAGTLERAWAMLRSKGIH